LAVKRIAGPALVALEEQDEALGLLDAGNRVAAESLRDAVDVHPDAFDKWLAGVAPVDPREAAADAAKSIATLSRPARLPCRWPSACS
jgi:hypothetical protein